MRKAIPLLFATFLLLAGCSVWVMVDGKYSRTSENYEVELPAGWRRHIQTWDGLRMTKDGLTLQRLTIARLPINRELPHTKKKLARGMLPEEAAEVVVDNIRSNPNIVDQQIEEDVPAKVGGYPGYKLVYTYRTRDGLKKKAIDYGVLVGNWHYHLHFEAPARYYFVKDQGDFEKLKDSFRILKGA